MYRENGICTVKCSPGKYFQKNPDKNDYTCKMNCDSTTDYKYITSANECVKNCPFGENFIGAGNKCKSKCDATQDGEYYYKSSESRYNEINYTI